MWAMEKAVFFPIIIESHSLLKGNGVLTPFKRLASNRTKLMNMCE